MIITIRCPYCNYSKRVLKEKIPSTIRWIRCSNCNQKFEFTHEESPTVEAPEFSNEKREEKRGPSLWEQRDELGIWKAIYLTLKEVILRPNRFFRNLNTNRGIKEPLAFGILFGTLGAMFGLFWQMLFFSGVGALSHLGFLGGIGAGLIFLLFIVLFPLLILFYLFLLSGIIHLCLMMLRGGGAGFEGTFRVMSYSQAIQVLTLIPVIGGFISGLYTLIVQIIGLKEIHESSYIKAVLGYFIPVTLAFLFIFILAMSILSSGM